MYVLHLKKSLIIKLYEPHDARKIGSGLISVLYDTTQKDGHDLGSFKKVIF